MLKDRHSAQYLVGLVSSYRSELKILSILSSRLRNLDEMLWQDGGEQETLEVHLMTILHDVEALFITYRLNAVLVVL